MPKWKLSLVTAAMNFWANRLNCWFLRAIEMSWNVSGAAFSKCLRPVRYESADLDYLRSALATGALGYVAKDRLASDLIPAMRAALAGRRFVSCSLPQEQDHE
jgi:hypothetical protein